MYKRLERSGKVDLKVGETTHLLRYYELLTCGKWVYFECVRPDSRRLVLRFDFDSYEITPEPLPGAAEPAKLHRYKYVPAEDKYYYLEIK